MSADLFTRHDAAPVDPARVVGRDTGKPYMIARRACSRCGGAGRSDKWYMTGYTCFDCQGSGDHVNGPMNVRLYTADQIARLRASADKRAAKKAAAAAVAAEARAAEIIARRASFEQDHGAILLSAEPYLERSDFLKDVIGKARECARLSDGQVDAIRTTVARFIAADAACAASRYVGEIGERLEKAVTVQRVNHYDRKNFGRGFGTETVWIVTSFDAAGNCYVTKSPTFFAKEGEMFTIRGTVKEHSEFRGLKQTVLQRAKKIESIHTPKESTP